jgi:hypothetical protein
MSMIWLKKIGGLFAGTPGPGGREAFFIKVKCNRCGEILEVRINPYNDLSVEYDDAGRTSGFSCRKVVRGNGRCFQPIEVVLQYDERRQLKDQTIQGGRFVAEE